MPHRRGLLAFLATPTRAQPAGKLPNRPIQLAVPFAPAGLEPRGGGGRFIAGGYARYRQIAHEYNLSMD